MKRTVAELVAFLNDVWAQHQSGGQRAAGSKPIRRLDTQPVDRNTTQKGDETT